MDIVQGYLRDSEIARKAYDEFNQIMVENEWFCSPVDPLPSYQYVALLADGEIASIIVYVERFGRFVEIRGALTYDQYRRQGLYTVVFNEMVRLIRDRYDLVLSGYNKNNKVSEAMQRKRGSVVSFTFCDDIETRYIISENQPIEMEKLSA